jgi:hypothetical protein
MQVTALAILSRGGAPVGPLHALANVARAAAAGGQPLPLQRLVLANGYLLERLFCSHTLAGLFMALPQLQHLHLELAANPDEEIDEEEEHVRRHSIAVDALRPLRRLTGLTSMYLEGPFWNPLTDDPADTADMAAQQIACLPSSLVRLEYCHSPDFNYSELVFDQLTGLTALRLVAGACSGREWLEQGYTQLQQLRSLHLASYQCRDEWLVEQAAVLQGLRPHQLPDNPAACFSQLVNLQSLDLLRLRGGVYSSTQLAEALAAVAAAPHLTQLRVKVPLDLTRTSEASAASAAAEGGQRWARGADLAPLVALTGLKALDVEADRASWCTALPLGLHQLSRLTRLHLPFDHSPTAVTCAWVCALQGLVNLQVLTVPSTWTVCQHHWLTGLTKLGVLELWEGSRWLVDEQTDLQTTAAHLMPLVSAQEPSMVPAGPSTDGQPAPAAAAGSSRTRSRGMIPQQLQLLCIDNQEEEVDEFLLHNPLYCHLWQELQQQDLALFNGSLKSFLRVGWQLWPAGKAERLQQLLEDML